MGPTVTRPVQDPPSCQAPRQPTIYLMVCGRTINKFNLNWIKFINWLTYVFQNHSNQFFFWSAFLRNRFPTLTNYYFDLLIQKQDLLTLLSKTVQICNLLCLSSCKLVKMTFGCPVNSNLKKILMALWSIYKSGSYTIDN